MMNPDVFYNRLTGLTDVTGKKIGVALSGGADSVALLCLAAANAKKLRYSLCAIHIEHGIRGESSVADAAFCKQLCEKLNIQFYGFSVDVLNNCQAGESTEVCARRLRYECFEQVDVDYILTAHHADDRIETFLINFVRGTGLKGLISIPAVRGKYLRPLLDCTKAELIEYLNSLGQPYCTDDTNNEEKYTRNLLRHKVLPVLKNINPSLDKTAADTFRFLADDEDYLTSEAAKAYENCFADNGLNVDCLKKLHPAIRLRVFRQFLSQKNIQISKQLSDRLNGLIFGENAKKIVVNEQLQIVRHRNTIQFLQNHTYSFSVSTKVVDKKTFDDCLKINNLLLKNAVDYDKIVHGIVIRTRLVGDKLKPCGRQVTKPLRRLQAEAGILPELRKILPVIADGNQPVWAAEIGPDENYKIDENSENILLINFYKNKK